MEPNKPRILFLTRKWSPAVGGMEVYCEKLVRELDAFAEPTLMALPGRPNGQPPTKAALAGFLLKCLWKLPASLRRHDLLHLADLVLWPLAVVAWFSGRPSIISVHGTDIAFGLRPGLVPRLYKVFLRLAVITQKFISLPLIANSQATARLCRQAGFQDVEVVKLGVDLADLSPREPQEKRYLLFVGRVEKRKGVSWFIREVLPLLPQDIELRIVGTIWQDDERRVIEENDRVTFLGPVFGAELARLRRNSLAVLMPNIPCGGRDFEGFGLTALEAGADGGILLAAGIDGIVDAVVDKKSGFLLTAENPVIWQLCLQRVAAMSEAEREDFIAGARRILTECYSWERVARETSEAYLRCLGRRHARGPLLTGSVA